MHILHINLERGWRGGERQTLFTLLGLRDLGHGVALVARSGGALAKAARNNAITVYECNSSVTAAYKLITLTGKYDVLHAQTAQAASILSLLKPLLKSLTVFTRRTAFTNKKRLKRHFWKWSRFDAMVAISAAAAQAPKDLGLPVTIIPSAVQKLTVDSNKVKDLVAEYGLDNRYVVLTASALSSEKDPITLIKAIDIARSVLPDVVCLHCGADGDAGPAAKAMVQQLKLEQHYIFTGFKANIGDYLALANLYASSSTFEALGTSVLDACLAGIPVVATDAGGHGEILRPDYGLLVNIGDFQAMAKKIIWLYQHQQVASDMSVRAQEMVAEQFSVPAMVSSYDRLYNSLRVLR